MQFAVIKSDPDVLIRSYAVYALVSIAMTVWVGRTLFRGGRVFLVDVFGGNDELADSINRLLVVGFYLVNFGFISLNLRANAPVPDAQTAVEAVSWKLGVVLLVLGGMHFFNLLCLTRARQRLGCRPAHPPAPPVPPAPPTAPSTRPSAHAA